ncbi:hypothetical protein [Halogeometricum luteum]|uniref:Uncharacterized protein n=1 Tax=Halogeometricum luteum TaxID=2950537 RepID=A0ABU2G3R7_9EURY|nr:hypothetical protein [Halogeometricum sp. S3BR5-2]MDS0295442.1 hypothetical protein [Halogeometricum sp. S3BR5-2]
MTCPFSEYRPLPDGDGTPRAYCAAAEEFVQAMRADICNDRYGLDHATDCEIYRANADGEVGNGNESGDAP